MKYKSYAKINLGLTIYNDKNDNVSKHNLETIMLLTDSLWDEITIEKSNFDEVIYYKDNKLLNVHSCLIQRSINYLREKFEICNKYKIVIYKNIPFGSGLGGGSSNAAVIIRKICEQENIDLKLLDYYDIALNLGSDIPFFLTEYNKAYVSGIGDKIQELPFDFNFKFNIHLLGIEVNTKLVFDNFLKMDQNQPKNDFKKIIDVLQNQGFTLEIFNNLQNSCFELFPNIKSKYNELLSKNIFCILSGAGSSLITIDSNVVSCPRIRTRYAPSPTGFFHIGGARTAIYNYLFAKHNNGDFIVRIEDTDIERNVEGGIESQLNNLLWLGVEPDESIYKPNEKYGPYIQSAKLKKYEQLAEYLVQNQKAYYCFCSKQELDNYREYCIQNHLTPKYSKKCLHLSPSEINKKISNNESYVIRLKISDDETFEWNDLIRGNISVPGSALTDPVILKANKIAMYNFAVVIDDYDMEITHVLRGEEHISNTPYQLAIAKALNKHMNINYGHLSIITDETHKKLSKRNLDLKQFISDYQKIGCLPEALFNFLVLLGWSPKDNNEIINKSELIKQFDINSLSKSPACFDNKKLEWISNEYFKLISNEQYLNFVYKFIDKKYINYFSQNILDEILLILKTQIVFANDINILIEEIFFNQSVSLNETDKQFLLNNKDVISSFNDLINLDFEFNIDNIKNIINIVKQKTNKKGMDLFMPIRIICTKIKHGPELAKLIYLIGRKNVLNNIKIILKELGE